MKSINLKSLIDIYNSNGNTIPEKYLSYMGKEYGITIKKDELNVLRKLLYFLEMKDEDLSLSNYNYFYLGYKIPQIGKEFDLLRFDDEKILNIEYKREIEEIDKIKKQLLRNKYYLKFLNKELILIGYIEKDNKIYMLENDDIKEISAEDLIKYIKNNKYCKEYNLNDLFKPSNYLISPFNKTESFMEKQYFLTEQQEKIEHEIFKFIEKNEKEILIQGDAGTGKTLLVYHLAREFIKKDKKVAIIHCGQLNEGHYKLNYRYNWNIFSIKNYKNVLVKKLDVVILDEVQRIQKFQFEEIRQYCAQNDSILIISGDGKQILCKAEDGTLEKIENDIKNKFKLTKKIRTNKELANFIKTMFNLSKMNENNEIDFNNIRITYFNTYKEANEYITAKENYSFISYTPTLFPQNGVVGFEITCNNVNTVGNSHKVIGQEFENVGVIIDKHFYYDENSKLKAVQMNNNVYSPKDMLYQAITRVIQTLEIIVVDNIDVFNKIISIIS